MGAGGADDRNNDGLGELAKLFTEVAVHMIAQLFSVSGLVLWSEVIRLETS